MILLLAATVSAGLFAGAALYINAVEHPARVSCGPELAVRVFAPSYRRAAIMQASLAVVGCVAGLLASWRERDPVLLLPSLLLLAVVPFTLLVVAPTNNQLLDPALDVRSKRSADLLTRWGRLHAVRSLLSLSAFLFFLWRIAER